MSTFTRKHYKAIAKVISERESSCFSFEKNQADGITIALAEMFEKDNPKFKRLLFIEKCQAEERNGD